METDTKSKYTIVQSRCRLKFSEMPRKDLRDYCRRFQEMLPPRIEELTKAVNSFDDFETWGPEFSPVSLSSLDDCLATQVQTRAQEELQKIRSGSRHPIPIENWSLTDRTISLAMDIGMYLQALLTNHLSLKWGQPFGGKNFIDYGQPVLV